MNVPDARVQWGQETRGSWHPPQYLSHLSTVVGKNTAKSLFFALAAIGVLSYFTQIVLLLEREYWTLKTTWKGTPLKHKRKISVDFKQSVRLQLRVDMHKFARGARTESVRPKHAKYQSQCTANILSIFSCKYTLRITEPGGAIPIGLHFPIGYQAQALQKCKKRS